MVYYLETMFSESTGLKAMSNIYFIENYTCTIILHRILVLQSQQKACTLLINVM
jgi:hypothetical protein